LAEYKTLLLLGTLLLIAAVLRMWQLEIKPPHFDEGINGHFVSRMWKDGYYKYDPTNFHGPLYFYFLQLAETFFGRGIFGFRFMTGLISIAIVALVAMHRRFVGPAAYWAAAITAIGTACVFYSRYAIHESLFIFLQVLFVYGFFLWEQERSKLAFALMVTGFFGTFAVKETFFIFFGTWAIAIGCVKLYEKWESGRASTPAGGKKKKEKKEKRKSVETTISESASTTTQGDVISIVVMGVLVTCLLFSGFFQNPGGIGDMFAAFKFWTKTGSGASGHEKPLIYYFGLMRQYEWALIAGLVLTPLAFFVSDRRGRLLALTAIGTFIAYSIIPYKTPWLILNIHWPLAFAFGIAADWLWRRESQAVKYASFAALVAVILGSVPTMLRLNFRDHSKSPGEPYVYVQSTMELKKVMDVVDQVVRLRPEERNMKLFVLNRDTWPLPWLFSQFPGLNYGQAKDAVLTGAKLVLIDERDRGVTEERLSGRYWVLPFQIRDAYEKGRAYLEYETFKDTLPPDSPTIIGGVK
jgi:uncharacterized protein (TIGR03663 family)